MWTDIWDYIGSVIRWWEWLALGALPMIISWLFKSFLRKKGQEFEIPKWLEGGTIFYAAVLIATFLAWREIKVAKDSTQQELDAQTKPIFVFDTFAVSFGGNPMNIPGTFITIEAGMANRGAQSTCIDYLTLISTPSGKTYVPNLHRIPKTGLRAVDAATGKNERFYYPEDTLAYKTRITPVPHNGRQDGYLFYFLPNVSITELARVKGEVEVSCKDINGNKHTGKKTLEYFQTNRPYIDGKLYYNEQPKAGAELRRTHTEQ